MGARWGQTRGAGAALRAAQLRWWCVWWCVWWWWCGGTVRAGVGCVAAARPRHTRATSDMLRGAVCARRATETAGVAGGVASATACVRGIMIAVTVGRPDIAMVASTAGIAAKPTVVVASTVSAVIPGRVAA